MAIAGFMVSFESWKSQDQEAEAMARHRPQHDSHVWVREQWIFWLWAERSGFSCYLVA